MRRFMGPVLAAVVFIGCGSGSGGRLSAGTSASDGAALSPDWERVFSKDPQTAKAAVERLEGEYGARAAAPFLEISRLAPGPSRQRFVLRALKLQGLEPVLSHDNAWRAVWASDEAPVPGYAAFKAGLYAKIDARFAEYFRDVGRPSVRLDELRWGGVRRDGIPPLDHPETVAADDPRAAYLNDTDVVFAAALNGDAVAYPKRILAWHEMVKDTIGGAEICGVYCTLCGSMIAYRADVGGTHHELGTSGFLYHSNKLMYDHATKSLWSTLEGRPVVGPLTEAADPPRLMREAVVTTTWGEWKTRHPDTRVLTLQTGHDRDYGEGVAYRDYFATDRLMFTVPETDGRLANKAEVVALRWGGSDQTLAVAVERLAGEPVYEDELDGRRFVILTDPSGANRVYQAGPAAFVSYADGVATDADGGRWRVGEDALASGDRRLERLPSHRAFWFGWHSAYPETRLVE